MPLFPSLFISHGSPDVLLHSHHPVLNFWRQLGSRLGQPKVILAISPHWSTPKLQVSVAAEMKTIHDFSGFPAELYQLQYPALGAPEFANRLMARLHDAGFEVQANRDRGLDHGVWAPLLFMYPNADIPIVQLSLQPNWSPNEQFKLGQALAPLRQDDALILATGSATHNLSVFKQYSFDAPPVDWAQAFDQWLQTTIAQADWQALLDYRDRAPHAVQNHPTDEHLLPLFVALGAAGQRAKGTRLHDSYTYGVLSMAAYQFSVV